MGVSTSMSNEDSQKAAVAFLAGISLTGPNSNSSIPPSSNFRPKKSRTSDLNRENPRKTRQREKENSTGSLPLHSLSSTRGNYAPSAYYKINPSFSMQERRMDQTANCRDLLVTQKLHVDMEMRNLDSHQTR